MIHVFRLGPVSSGSSRTWAFVGLVEGAEPRVHEASSEHEAFEALRSGALGQPLSCEPALAEEGKRLGIDSAPLPPGVLRVRAILAYEYASGLQGGGARREAIAAFLKGAAAFWAARAWEVVAPEERLHVAFLEGRGEVEGELSVLGGDGMRLPGVALCDDRAALAVVAKAGGEERAEAVLRLANLTVDLERDPDWAAEAIEEGFALPRLPVAARRRGGAETVVTQDLVVAAALLEAVAAFTGIDEEGAVGVGTAEASGMRVVARVRPSDQLRAASGLTPVPEPSSPTAAAAAVPSPQEDPAPPPALPTTPSAPETAALPPAEGPPEPRRADPESLLTRALRFLRGAEQPKPGPTAVSAPEPEPEPEPQPQPPAKPAEPEPPPPADEGRADPFTPFAHALRVVLPAPLPEPAPEDAAAIAALAARVVEAATPLTNELGSFPAVTLQIIERVQDPKADARGVAGFVSRDPALAADIVAVANSAAFRGVSEIESVHDAVARLGLAEVGRVASAVAARKVLAPRGDEDATRVFVRSVAVATTAASAALRQPGARADHVWLGGLLHDVGQVLARRLLAREEASTGAHLSSELGARVVDRTHVQVGEAAVRRWGLPAYLQAICARHHDEDLPAGDVDLHLVRLVSALACLGDPLVAARAAREIVQSAGALRLGAPAVRALATELRLAEDRARVLVR